jgi:ABC-type branched-subunit amino acid transport system substrate-binding protein
MRLKLFLLISFVNLYSIDLDIMAPLPLSGSLSNLAKQALYGLKLAENDLKSQGINIKIRIIDTTLNFDNLKKSITSSESKIIICCLSDTFTKIAFLNKGDKKIVSFSPFQFKKINKEGIYYLFPDHFETVKITTNLINEVYQKNDSRLAIIYDSSSSYSMDNARILSKNLNTSIKQMNIDMFQDDNFFKKIVDLDVDMIYISSYSNVIRSIVKKIRNQGIVIPIYLDHFYFCIQKCEKYDNVFFTQRYFSDLSKNDLISKYQNTLKLNQFSNILIDYYQGLKDIANALKTQKFDDYMRQISKEYVNKFNLIKF